MAGRAFPAGNEKIAATGTGKSLGEKFKQGKAIGKTDVILAAAGERALLYFNDIWFGKF